jgi:hypothetical protein
MLFLRQLFANHVIAVLVRANATLGASINASVFWREMRLLSTLEPLPLVATDSKTRVELTIVFYTTRKRFGEKRLRLVFDASPENPVVCREVRDANAPT